MKEEDCNIDYDEDDFEDGYPEPDYYYCNCCGHTQQQEGMGNSCDSCGLFGVMEEDYF